jgi:hypothetical protein
MTGVAGQDRLPVFGLIFLGGPLLDLGHFVGFREIKYRIACHNDGSIRRRRSEDHPDLAVKVNIVRNDFSSRLHERDARAYTYFSPSTR